MKMLQIVRALLRLEYLNQCNSIFFICMHYNARIFSYRNLFSLNRIDRAYKLLVI